MTKRRRKSRPAREPGLPITKRVRDELILPAYSALTVMQMSGDADALESAFNTLAAFVNYIRVAAQNHPRMSDELEPATGALLSIQDRHAETGTSRPSGPELMALRRAVVWADENLGSFRTTDIQRACVEVHEALYGEKV